jgi:hypothetical protein
VSDNTFSFPDPNIDPRKKDKSYILQYAKAAFNTSKGYGCLYFNRERMAEIRSYALGAQKTDKYFAQLLPNENADESWLNINRAVLPILPKFREIAIARIMQQGIDVQIKAVDPLSKSEEDARLNQLKVKIQMREMAQQSGSELANSPLLQSAPNEPEDLEQLQMEEEFGYKHVMAMEAELAVELANQNNNFEELDGRVVANLVDYGIGGLTQWIDENGSVCEREINPRNLIISKCLKNDFSDLQYWGEVVEVPLTRLAMYFSPAEMKALCEKAKGKIGNPLTYDDTKQNYYEGFKVWVFDGKFLDVNTKAYEERIDDDGNLRFGKTKYNYIAAATEQTSDGQPRYMASTTQVTYKFKWVIDSEFIYDFGLSENMSRKESSYWNTNLDIQLYAWNFENMEFHGLTERLMPMADDVCLTWYKMQNLRNTLMPYILNMDLDSFEGIGFGKAGQATNPLDAVNFLFSKYVAVYRSLDKFTNNPNYKPVSVESTGQLTILAQYRDELFGHIDLMRQTCGLNEITDGSTPNAKNLNSTNAAGIESTNNALYPIHNAHKYIVLKAADNKVQKQQIAVKLGKVQGLVRALGRDTMIMYQINPDISLREFGLASYDAPTRQQREMLWQEINQKESMGLLDVTDKHLIMETPNLKQAMRLLAYRIKKRKEKQEQFEIQKIQEQNQSQAEMSVQVEQSKQQTIQLQAALNMQQLNAQMQWNFVIEKMKKEIDFNAESVQAEARNVGHQIQAEAKVIATHIQVEGAKDKQHIANKKKAASK